METIYLLNYIANYMQAYKQGGGVFLHYFIGDKLNFVK